MIDDLEYPVWDRAGQLIDDRGRRLVVIDGSPREERCQNERQREDIRGRSRFLAGRQLGRREPGRPVVEPAGRHAVGGDPDPGDVIEQDAGWADVAERMVGGVRVGQDPGGSGNQLGGGIPRYRTVHELIGEAAGVER